MGTSLSKQQRDTLLRVAPAVLLLWRRILTTLLVRLRLPTGAQWARTLLYSALLASPAVCAGAYARVRAATGVSERTQTAALLGALQVGCNLIPSMASLFEACSGLFRAAADLPPTPATGGLAGVLRTRGVVQFALTYFCSFSLIFFYNEFPECYLPFYRKYIRVLSGEAFSAWHVVPVEAGGVAPAGAPAAAALEGAVGGWARNANAHATPQWLPLYRSVGVAANPQRLLAHMRTSVPTFVRMLLFLQCVVKPLLRARAPDLVWGPARALRTTLALQWAGTTHYVLNRLWLGGGGGGGSGAGPWAIWATRLVGAAVCSMAQWIDRPNEIRPMLSVMLANMAHAYLNLATHLLLRLFGTTGKRHGGVSLLRVFEVAYPIAAVFGVVKSPLTDTVVAALQPPSPSASTAPAIATATA